MNLWEIRREHNIKYDKLLKISGKKIDKIEKDIKNIALLFTTSYEMLKHIYYNLNGDMFDWDINNEIKNSYKKYCEYYPKRLDIFATKENYLVDDWCDPFVLDVKYEEYLKNTTKLFNKIKKLELKLNKLLDEFYAIVEEQHKSNPFYLFNINDNDRCKRGVIYRLIFPDGKSYIGQTKRCLIDRILEHSFKIENPKSKKEIAIRDFKMFNVEVLDYGSNLDYLEQYYINKFDSYNNGYNSTPDGQGY